MNAQLSTFNPGAVLGLRELRERFGMGPRRARGLMRRMRHLREGRDLFTTEAWLAEYVAAAALPGSHWPATDRDREPVDEDVVKRAVELIGVLAGRGQIKVQNIG